MEHLCIYLYYKEFPLSSVVKVLGYPDIFYFFFKYNFREIIWANRVQQCIYIYECIYVYCLEHFSFQNLYRNILKCICEITFKRSTVLYNIWHIKPWKTLLQINYKSLRLFTDYLVITILVSLFIFSLFIRSGGRRAEEVFLEVQAPPEVTVFPTTGTFKEHGNITLKCNARGTPPPVIFWAKDGNYLPGDDSRITVEDNFVLRIEDAGIDDQGSYICLAENPAGRGN